MKLSCPSCSAKYSIADEKVQDRLAKIRCRKCSATIIIDGKMEPPNVYTSDGQQGAAGADSGSNGSAEVGPGEYSVDFGDNDQRTMSIAQIVAAYNVGEVTADTYVWTEGMGDWQPLGEVPQINDALHSAAGESPAAAAPGAAMGFSAPAVTEADPPRAATRSGSGRGSAHDLFGSIATAGSEEDVTTSAPHPPAAAAAPTATGARNESSVLFSLSALTASAGPPVTETSPSKVSSTSSSNGADDDSGLIDLKALTSAAGDQSSSPLHVSAAPLGMAAPLGGITAMPTVTDTFDMPRPSSSKTGLYIGGAIFAGFLVIGGAIAFSGGRDASAEAAENPAAAAAPTAPAEETLPSKEAEEDESDHAEVTAKPPATGTAAAEEEAKLAAEQKEAEAKQAAVAPKPRRTWKPPTTTQKKATPEPTSTPTPTKTTSSSSTKSTPKKKKPKSKSCNCAPSDLMCAMKCAAG